MDVAPGVVLRVCWVEPLPADHIYWVESALGEDLPAGARLVRVAVTARPTATGLPMVFAHYQVQGPAGALLEERVGAFYRILHDGAEARVRLRDGARWSQHAPVLGPLLDGGLIAWPRYQADLIYTLLGMEGEAGRDLSGGPAVATSWR